MRMAALHPHPGSEPGDTRGIRIEAGAAFHPKHLELMFELTSLNDTGVPDEFADLPKLRGARTTELWKEICFEAFLPIQNSEAYFEFNGALNGDWDLYQFDSYRSGMRRVPAETSAAPELLFREQGDSRFRIAFTIPLVLFPETVKFDPIGLTMVLKTKTGTSYWALKHDGTKPDFHLRASFLYDPIRN
jgi:hypothetical protein